MGRLDGVVLETLFTEARTHRAWRDAPVSDETLRELYALVRMGPTAMNAQPARFVFVKSPMAKEKLKPALAEGNVEKTMTAPVTAIVASDAEFGAKLAALSPSGPKQAAQIARISAEARERMARLSATLEVGYLIVAARALGLDCGPMSGFDNAALDAAFFSDGRWRSLLLVNLGHGDGAALRPRAPRLEFEEACRIL